MPKQSLSEPIAIRLDEISATVTYVGEAVIGTADGAAAWRIKRITTTGTVLDIKWADGDNLFNNIWDNRASISYS